MEEKLSHGLLDFGLFIEPFTADAYDFVRLPAQDELCVVTTSDGSWHAHTSITPAILRTMPLLLSSRT